MTTKGYTISQRYKGNNIAEFIVRFNGKFVCMCNTREEAEQKTRQVYYYKMQTVRGYEYILDINSKILKCVDIKTKQNVITGKTVVVGISSRKNSRAVRTLSDVADKGNFGQGWIHGVNGLWGSEDRMVSLTVIS